MSRLIASCARNFYSALLRCYPRAFRDAHGRDATALFAEACAADWTRAGAWPVVRRFASALCSVPAAGISERRSANASAAGRLSSGPAGPALFADVRHAMKSLLGRKGRSIAIVVTLAIGLGVNIAVFSLIDATLLRPLPYEHAGRVVWLQAAPPSGRAFDPQLSWARKWAAATTAIERIEARRQQSVLVTGAGAATRERVIRATPGYLGAIGVTAVAGRLLGPDDGQVGAARVVVISSGLWRERFGGSRDVLGRSITLDGIDHQIIGIASNIPSDIPGLRFRLVTSLIADDSGSGERVLAVAWLRRGVAVESAQAEVSALAPITDDGRVLHATLTPPRNIFWTIPVFRTIEIGLGIAAMVLLIIAGVNVANLLLAAGQARAGDLALRRALGASTFRLVRLQIIETTTLAFAGASIGLGLAWAAVQGFASLDPGPQLRTPLEGITLDPVVTAYAYATSLLVALTFGMAPALRGARALGDLRHQSARAATRLRRGPSVLVAVETALAAVLLVAAGVVGHAFLSMQLADRGFDADRVLGVRIALPSHAYATPAQRSAFFTALLNETSKIDGVEGSTLGYGATPPFDFLTSGQLARTGSSLPAAEVNAAASFVVPGYFRLMGIPLLQGADFSAADAASSQIVPAVVSRSFANEYWPAGDALGAVFSIAEPRRTGAYRVIGIAGDVSFWSLLSPGCRKCDAHLYLPMPEQRQYTDVLLRIRAGVAPPVAALQAAVARVDPRVPADDELQTAAAGLSSFISQPRFNAVLFATFAFLAIALVAVGLSAVISHAVAQRTREMGIRMALGAHRSSVLRLVVAQGLRPAAIGLAIGIGAALVVTRFMGSMLYGISPADPFTLIGAPALLLTIAVAALLVPATRATRVDPARILKSD